MPMDGCFIHYLVNELNESLENSRINKITSPNPSDIILQLRCKKNDEFVNKQLLLSSRLDAPAVYLTDEKYINPPTPSNFCMVLRKYLERGIIKDIHQYQNDRIIIIDIETYNELEDLIKLSLIIELMGRSSNIILIKEDYTIIDAIRKLPPSQENLRTILPKAIYHFKENDKKINPFTDTFFNLDGLQGISKILYNHLLELPINDVKGFLNQPLRPIIYQNKDKLDFYSYPINDDVIIKETHNLSNLIEEFYKLNKKNDSSSKIELEKIIKKELKKCYHKQDNLELDLDKANNNLIYNEYGILLQASLYQIKKGDKEFKTTNFLHNNEDIIIPLDPLLEPNNNLKHFFNLGKKAKKTLLEAKKQQEINNEDINYYENILFQLSQSTNEEVEEIKKELINIGIIQNKKGIKNNKQKLKINKIIIDDIIIYYGKNNLQNEEITHKLSSSNDYWFHVKDLPSSHVLVKVPNNDKDYILPEKVIRAAANLAAKGSKAFNSSSVPVDYTKIKYLKKIPGNKGYHVIYSNQKTIYIDPK